MSRILTISSSDDLRKIINSKEPILIDFYADWCNPCKLMTDILFKLSLKYVNIKFVKIDFETSKDLVNEYHIIHLPTLLALKNCEEIYRLVGFDEVKIMQIIEVLSCNILNFNMNI